MKSFGARSYESGSDSPLVQCTDNEVGNFLSVVNEKRCAETLNASIPTKRARTASRRRVPSHVNPETSGSVQAPIKTDASRKDTTSFQGDQTTLNGGLQTPNTLEVESLRDFDEQTLYGSISPKPKKKETKIMVVFFLLDIRLRSPWLLVQVYLPRIICYCRIPHTSKDGK